MTRLERVKLIGHNQASIPIGKSRIIIIKKRIFMISNIHVVLYLKYNNEEFNHNNKFIFNDGLFDR